MKTFSEYLGTPKCGNAHGNQRQAVLPYLAGIIDGEGTIRIWRSSNQSLLKTVSRQNPWYAPYISVGMVERVVPELLKETFGGSVREERVPERRSVWRWAASGPKTCLIVIQALIPYLIVKRPQAVLMLQYIDGLVDMRGHSERVKKIKAKELRRREELYLLMKELNAVGAAATTERESIREDEATVWTIEKSIEGS